MIRKLLLIVLIFTLTFSCGILDSNSLKTEDQIIISKNNLSLKIGQSEKLTATVVIGGKKGVSDIIWVSDDQSVALVDNNGNVEAVKEGSTSITVTVKGNNSLSKKVNIKIESSVNIEPSKELIPLTLNDINERVNINGNIYDLKGALIDDVTIKAKSIEPSVVWESNEQKSIAGRYVIRNVPVGIRIEIKVSKPGWTTRIRTEVLKPNVQVNRDGIIFNFGGQGKDYIYAIHDEPEINKLLINGKSVSDTESGIIVENRDLELNFTFSEKIQNNRFEEAFLLKNKFFIIDKSISEVRFNWSPNEPYLIVIIPKSIINKLMSDFQLGNTGFSLEFSKSFTDRSGKEPVKGRYFRFSNDNSGDQVTFSYKNQ